MVSVGLEVDGPEAVVRIADGGIGIGAEDLPRIFDRFYRGSVARTRQPGGAGLGLAVAKWIVESHPGTIACTSELARGTEVMVRLPAPASVQ